MLFTATLLGTLLPGCRSRRIRWFDCTALSLSLCVVDEEKEEETERRKKD